MPPARSLIDLCHPPPVARKGRDRQDPTEPATHQRYVGRGSLYNPLTYDNNNYHDYNHSDMKQLNFGPISIIVYN